MDKVTKMRLGRIRPYEQIGKLGIICNKCGISRPTLYKWLKRYRSEGIEGLKDHSRNPHYSPNQKIQEADIQLIFKLRSQRKLGIRRLQTELQRLHGISFVLSTLHKYLIKNNTPPLNRKRYYRKPINPLQL